MNTENIMVKVAPAPRKVKIPKALREQVWLQTAGKQFEIKCPIRWCQNRITAFDFHTGHNIPESAGGATDLSNLMAICARCNLSMGHQYTITEWNKKGGGVEEVASSCCWKWSRTRNI